MTLEQFQKDFDVIDQQVDLVDDSTINQEDINQMILKYEMEKDEIMKVFGDKVLPALNLLNKQLSGISGGEQLLENVNNYIKDINKLSSSQVGGSNNNISTGSGNNGIPEENQGNGSNLGSYGSDSNNRPAQNQEGPSRPRGTSGGVSGGSVGGLGMLNPSVDGIQSNIQMQNDGTGTGVVGGLGFFNTGKSGSRIGVTVTGGTNTDGGKDVGLGFFRDTSGTAKKQVSATERAVTVETQSKLKRAEQMGVLFGDLAGKKVELDDLKKDYEDWKKNNELTTKNESYKKQNKEFIVRIATLEGTIKSLEGK